MPGDAQVLALVTVVGPEQVAGAHTVLVA